MNIKNKQEFRGTPRCTGSQIVDLGFNDRNMGKVTNGRTERERKTDGKR